MSNGSTRPIEIQKSDTEKIVIAVRKYEGMDYIDFRTHLRMNPCGEWMPSTKGITIPMRQASELRRAIDRLFAENEFSQGG